MNADYSKRVYAKVLELEKKVEKLQKELLNRKENVLVYDLNLQTDSTFIKKDISVSVINNCLSKVDVSIKCSVENEIIYQLFLNSKLVKSGSFIGGKDNFSMQLPLQKGDTNLSFEFASSVGFKIDASVIISGNVDYKAVNRRLSVVDYNLINYVSYLSEGTLSLYKCENSNLEKVFELYDVIDGCVSCSINSKLYIPIVAKDNKLKVYVYDVISSVGTTYDLKVSGVVSVCGFEGENGAVIIFSLGGKIYKGNFEINQPYFYNLVNRRGVKVYSEPTIKGAYVIQDNVSAKLILENELTCVLDKGDYYHLERIDGGYNVTYKKDDKLYKKEINERINSPYVLDYCDEIVKLNDNKILKRVRDKLTVE